MGSGYLGFTTNGMMGPFIVLAGGGGGERRYGVQRGVVASFCDGML